jgi:hypothetical protein
MNNFYSQHKIVQWIAAIVLLVVGFVPALAIIEKGYDYPLVYALFLVYLPIGQFSLTPIFRLSGVYRYYSPMLLGYMPNDRQIDLHSGGSFDYLIVMRKHEAGVEMRNRLLVYHLEGLLHLIDEIAHKRIPETVHIVGTSYFFNARTLAKMGFEVVQPSLFYRLNLLVNFIDLVWMYSLSQGKFALPKVWNAKKASITGAKLVEQKAQIAELCARMNTKTTR